MAGEELRDRIIYYRDVWMPARDIVKKGIDERFNVRQHYDTVYELFY